MNDSINNPIEQKKNMYLTSLLSETLPSSLLTADTLKEFDIDIADSFGVLYIYFGNELKNVIETRHVEDIVHWKSVLHESMLEPLSSDTMEPISLLNTAPYTRTIIYSVKRASKASLKECLKAWFKTTSAYMAHNNLGQFQAFADPELRQFQDIGKSYKQLRLLMNYRYTVGMDTLTFYDEMTFNEDYSVTEYKYLQRYETLLSLDNNESLDTILDDIYKHICDHSITDSKVIYIYKELISITIKHLYSKETEYLHEISELNQAINDFEATFDDAIGATDFLKKALSALRLLSDDARYDYHPHINKVLKLIDEHYQDNIGLSDIANQLKLSDAYLSRLFKEEIGTGFKDYLTRYRLNIIKDLLEHSSKSIITIAKETGYNNPDQLTRIFKKYEQMTPSEYRHHPSSPSS